MRILILQSFCLLSRGMGLFPVICLVQSTKYLNTRSFFMVF